MKKTRNFAIKVTGLYILIGGLWILFSDKLAFYLFKDLTLLNQVSTYKGWFYVLFTGFLLWTLINNEISKRNAIEKEYLKAKLKAEEHEKLKVQFLLNIHHEIRTPLNGFLGFLSLVKESSKFNAEESRFYNQINQSADRFLATVNNIMELSQIELDSIKITPTVFSIQNTFEQMVYDFNLLKKKNKATIILTTNYNGFENEIFLTDFEAFTKILKVLIENAIKFTLQGSIEFGIEKKENDFYTFYVKDTGLGIETERLNTIFNKFGNETSILQPSAGGTGIGLAIAKGLVRLLGGKIWVESVFGDGSIFRFTIPIQTQ